MFATVEVAEAETIFRLETVFARATVFSCEPFLPATTASCQNRPETALALQKFLKIKTVTLSGLVSIGLYEAI
jgi:hypothetical protein